MKIGLFRRTECLKMGVLLLLPCVGCVTFDNFFVSDKAHGEPSQAEAVWKTELVMPPNSENRGAPLPGLAGMLYLFGKSGKGAPLIDRGQGKIMVDMFDPMHPDASGQPKLLQHWEFGNDIVMPAANVPDPIPTWRCKVPLERLLQKDFMGHCFYTMFLPWPEQQANIQRVQLQASYVTEKGFVIYAPRSTITIRREALPGVQVTSQMNLPAASATQLAAPGGIR